MTKIEPHCIEWSKTGWVNTFHSTPPKDADIKTKLYTEAQMRQLASSVADVCDPLGICANERNELIKEVLG